MGPTIRYQAALDAAVAAALEAGKLLRAEFHRLAGRAAAAVMRRWTKRRSRSSVAETRTAPPWAPTQRIRPKPSPPKPRMP